MKYKAGDEVEYLVGDKWVKGKIGGLLFISTVSSKDQLYFIQDPDKKLVPPIKSLEQLRPLKYLDTPLYKKLEGLE